MPNHYKYELLYLVIANTVASYLFEKVFIGWFSRYYNNREQSKTRKRQLQYLAQLEAKKDRLQEEDNNYRRSSTCQASVVENEVHRAGSIKVKT